MCCIFVISMNISIQELKVNKISKKKSVMGNNYEKHSGFTIKSTDKIKANDFVQNCGLINTVQNHNLNSTKLVLESKKTRMDNKKNIDQKKGESKTAIQAPLVQAVTVWTELCWRVKKAYRVAAKKVTADTSIINVFGCDVKRLVDILWRDDWQQLLLKLQALLREVAIEQRERLRHVATVQSPNYPEVYVQALLHSHYAFCATGNALTPCLPAQVNKFLRNRFGSDFKLLNARMFESCVYSDPIVQDNVPAAIGRTAGADRQLVHSYLALDEQMTDVASRWLDVKKLILKFGKGRAQLLNDWKASKELRELALESMWIVRKKPPPLSLPSDFDVLLLSLTDELSTDRSCVCTLEDNLPDTPPLSPDLLEPLKLVTKTSHLLTSDHVHEKITTNQSPIIEKVPIIKFTKNTIKANSKSKKTTKFLKSKENQIPKISKTENNSECLTSSKTDADLQQKNNTTPTKKTNDNKKCKKENCNITKTTTCQCECPHNSSAENSAGQVTKYNKLRERLRTRLKEKRKEKKDVVCSPENTDSRDIAQLLDFIEGNDNITNPVRSQKNAAKKLRRQERKLEAARQKLEEERLLQEQERSRIEQEAAMKAAELRAQNAKAKREKNNQQTGNDTNKKVGPMVTIKRVIQGSNKEPTVTITLKGSTPDKDKLLFTLINGQSESTEKSTNSKLNTSHIDQSRKNLSRKQRKKLKKEQVKTSLQQLTQNVAQKEISNTVTKTKTIVNSNSNPNACNVKKKENVVKVPLETKTDNILNLQMLRLPPGITITKVEGPTEQTKLQLNPKTALTNIPVQNTTSIQSNDNRSGIIVVDTVKLKEELPLATEKNPSQKSKKSKQKKNKKAKNAESKSFDLKNSSMDKSSNIFTLKNPMFYQVQDGNSDASKNMSSNQQASIIKGVNGMVTIRSPRLGSCNGNIGVPFMTLQPTIGDTKPAHILGELKPIVQSQPSLPTSIITRDRPFDAQQILSGLPGIEITKINKGATRARHEKAAFQPADVSIIPTNMSANGDVYKLFYDNADWSLESVFAPKDLKEDEILDAEELELEAFKRFCQQSIPPERKEKVAFLNVKDIILKKKSSEKC